MVMLTFRRMAQADMHFSQHGEVWLVNISRKILRQRRFIPLDIVL